MQVPAGEFKARCLQLIEAVRRRQCEVVITKRGRPVAKLVPLDEPAPRPLFGYLKGSVTVTGDIVAPVGDAWEVEHGR
jgi:prevent-host-death family protein